MRKLLVAVGLLFCFGALAQAADAPATTITFGKGTTVAVNGQPVASGYQLKKGDIVKITGGKAKFNGVDSRGRHFSLPMDAGSTVTVTAQTDGSNVIVVLSRSSNEGIAIDVAASSLAPNPPPPSAQQNTAVQPAS